MKKAPSPTNGKSAGNDKRFNTRRAAAAAFAALAAAVALSMFVALVTAQAPAVPVVATVRHAPALNGRVEGSLQMLAGEYLTLNSGGIVKGDLLVPGTPTVVRNGTPVYQGTIDGSGSASPSNYQVTLNSGSEVRYVRRRVDPVSLAPVAVPPSPSGTRYVTVNSPGQSVGTWATVRNLTLNSNVGAYAVPAGTYGNFTANGGGSFVLGTAGATQASVYNFEDITLNSLANLQVVGPVVVNVANRVSVSSSCVVGSAANPRWLALNVSRYDVTINGGQVYGVVRAPAGSVSLSAATLKGEVACDRLTLNGGTIVGVQTDSTPPTLSVSQPSDGALLNATSVNVTGTFTDESATTVNVNGVAATVSGNAFSATVPLSEGANTLNVVATDAAGNSSTVSRSVTRDTTAPALSLQQPSNGSVTAAAAVTVAGTATDAAAVTVTVNGAGAPLTQQSFSASVPLAEGANTITVVATDSAGNRSELTRSVVRDSGAPVIAVEQPSDETLTRQGQVAAAGTVSDSGAVSLTVNGAAAALSGNRFSVNVPLANEGENVIVFRATDGAGNVTETKRKVLRDTRPPALTLTSPAEGSAARSLVVSGAAEDASLVTMIADGRPVEVDYTGTFNTELSSPEGRRQVRFVATDAAGNTAEITRTLTVDVTPPGISSLTPSDGSLVDSPATVRGRVSDATAVTLSVNGAAATVGDGGLFESAAVALANDDGNAVELRARDAAGNESSAVLTLNRRDRTPPAPPTVFPFNSPTRLPVVTLDGRAEPGSRVSVVGGTEEVAADAAAGTGLFTAVVKVPAGTSTLGVTAADAAGNSSGAVQLTVVSDPAAAPPPPGVPPR